MRASFVRTLTFAGLWGALAIAAFAQAPSTNRSAVAALDEWQRQFRALQELQLRQLRLDLEAERLRDRLRSLREEKARWEAREKQLKAETASARATLDEARPTDDGAAPRAYMALVPARLRAADGTELPVATMDIVVGQTSAGADGLAVARDGRAFSIERSAVASERELLSELEAQLARIEEQELAVRQSLGRLEAEDRERSSEQAKYQAAVDALTSGRISDAAAVDFQSAGGTRTMTLSEIRRALAPLAGRISALREGAAKERETLEAISLHRTTLARLMEDIRARFAAHAGPAPAGASDR